MLRSPPPLTVNENHSCDRSRPFGRYERKCLLHIRWGHVTRLIITSPLINISYNIARVLALYKSYLAAMNKIFIYACPYVNNMTWGFFYLASEFPSFNWEFTKTKTITIALYHNKRFLRADPCCRSVFYLLMLLAVRISSYGCTWDNNVTSEDSCSCSLLLCLDLDLMRYSVLHHYLKITIWSSSTITAVVSI